jgi:hypothetical protein
MRAHPKYCVEIAFRYLQHRPYPKTGGTCFGGSGGPNFIGSSNVVVGVTSFGKNGTCGSTGGVHRVGCAAFLCYAPSVVRNGEKMGRFTDVFGDVSCETILYHIQA